MATVETFTGAFHGEVSVRRVRYATPDRGWAVLDATGEDGDELVLVGPLGHLEAGERARVAGQWVDDVRYGPQIKVTEATPLAPIDAESVALYLRRVKQIGAARATKLIDHFGADRVLDAIDADAPAAFAVAGLSRRAVQTASDSWERLRSTRRLHLLLAPHGLAYLVGRLHEAYGDSAHRVVSERPYELTSLFGVGFLIADRIARGIGCLADDPERERAAVLHLLADAERAGSTCMPLGALRDAAAELLGHSPEEALVDRLVDRGDLVRVDSWVYRRAIAELEAELAVRVGRLARGDPSERLSKPSAAKLATSGAELTSEQRGGVANAFQRRLSVITGGPGTGKTASIRTIASIAASSGARVLLVAPTGRAAIRMTEASAVRAKTIHSALGWIPGEGPTHDERDPLACDVLIVDETSMANLELLVTLLRAVAPETHVVLVGDADQLAPVGAGKPFAELVGSGSVPTVRLTHIFRQAAGSMIVHVVPVPGSEYSRTRPPLWVTMP